jgi:putative MATE family efflux protein
VLRLAWPAILTGLLGTAVFLGDRVMLARYDQQALASMQLQGPLLWSVTSVFMASCVGAVALVARSVGAGDLDRARAVARATLRIAGGLGLVIAVVAVALLDWLVVVFGPPEPELRAMSAGYLAITFAALPATFVATAASLVMGGYGDTRTPLLAGLVANAANIGVNAVLIYGVDHLGIPALGVRGAAIGTAVAFVLEALVLSWRLGRRAHPLCTAGWWRPVADPSSRAALGDIMRLSLPAIGERVLVHAGFLTYAKAITTLGAVSMAAHQALVTVESICFMCADGFGVAAATVMGQQLGRGQPELARAGGRLACFIAFVAITTAGVLVWITGPWTLAVFVPTGSDGTALVDTGLAVLPLLAASQPGMTVGIVLAMGLRGAGDTRSPLWAAIAGGLVVRTTLAWSLVTWTDLGLRGIWIASAVDWSIRAVWLSAVFRRGAWTTLRV